MKVATRYEGGMRFSSGEGVAKIVMDAGEAVGGRGEALAPKQVVLQGLIGCTGMDVAAILHKRNVDFEDFELEAEATQTRSTPRVFETIHIVYRIKARPEDREAVLKAIKASQSWFCGVSEMLRKTAKLTWELDLQPLA